MARYLWKPGVVGISIDPQTVGETLEAVRITNGGTLEPEAVVEASRPSGAPLHPCFEWDDAVAAEKYRTQQARHLINHITVEVSRGAGREPMHARAFVSVVQDDERSYTSTLVAMADPALRRQLVQTAFRELKVWRERYKSYQELSRVFEAVDALDAQAA